jgi:predicted polyphosphate/ATP-dependent NAD kinase
MKQKVGLIVNPIAGMGGKVGLKGTDGAEILKKAILIGARPEAPRRALQALARLAGLRDELHVLTYPGEMGESELAPSGFEHTVLGSITPGDTTAEDTEQAAREMRAAGAELLLFVGGDGTARNIHNAIGDQVPVLGIPAGVKMHSAVFGTTPGNAGQLALLFLKGKTVGTREAEVMDIDEDAFRDQRLSARLYGYLRVPFERKLVQSVKAGAEGQEDAVVRAIALDVISGMEPDSIYIIGPGTTTREIMGVLDLPNTLLGVDVVLNKSLVASDVNEGELLEAIEGKPARIVVTIIGGQGYLFGRGNQQISDRVIERVGKDNIIVIATKSKLFALNGEPMLVDTGNDRINEMLSGYVNVTTGVREKLVYKVSS